VIETKHGPPAAKRRRRKRRRISSGIEGQCRGGEAPDMEKLTQIYEDSIKPENGSRFGVSFLQFKKILFQTAKFIIR
jgi:hypothetical protein